MNTKIQTIDQSQLADLHLEKGGHANPKDGLCFLEAVAYLTGEPHSDRPECVSPVLGSWGRAINDAMPDARRQELKVFIFEMVGTAGDGKDEARSFMCADFAVGVIAPMALDAAGLSDHATKLRELPEIVDKKTAAVAAVAVYRASAAAAVAAYGAAAYGATDDAYRATDDAYRAATDAEAVYRASAAAYGAATYGAADDAYRAADDAEAVYRAAYAADAAYRAAAASPVWDAVIAFTPKLITSP